MLYYLSNLSKEFHHEFSALREPLGEETVTVDLYQVDVVVAGMGKNFIKIYSLTIQDPILLFIKPDWELLGNGLAQAGLSSARRAMQKNQTITAD